MKNTVSGRFFACAGLVALACGGCSGKTALRPDSARAHAPCAESQAAACVPFGHPVRLVGWKPLRVSTPGMRAHVPHSKVVGAVIELQLGEAVGAQRLGRMIECHLAQRGAERLLVAQTSDCPLDVAGVEVSFRVDGGRASVKVEGRTRADAREIVARTRRLVLSALAAR